MGCMGLNNWKDMYLCARIYYAPAYILRKHFFIISDILQLISFDLLNNDKLKPTNYWVPVKKIIKCAHPSLGIINLVIAIPQYSFGFSTCALLLWETLFAI